MSPGAGSPWQPAPPGDASVVWEEAASGAPRPHRDADAEAAAEAAAMEPSTPRAGSSPGGRPRRVGPVVRAWRRASPGRLLLVGYVAVAVVAAVVTALLGPGQPHYGAETPWRGVATTDIRTEPSGGGWAVDLADTLAPGSRPACLRFPTATVSPGRVLVSAAPGWTYGFANDSGCGSETTGIGSRLALLDTDAGRFEWVHDVADDARQLGLEGPVDVASASLAGDTGLVVVRVVAGADAVLLSLSATTGRTEGRSAPQRTTESDRFEASGTVVVTSRQPSPGERYEHELRDARDLSRVTWSGRGTTAGLVLALPDRLVVSTPDGSVQVDARSGEASAWGTRLDDLSGHLVHDDLLVGPSEDGAGVTARSPDGTVRWRSDPTVAGTLAETRACLVATDVTADRVTCLSWETGDVVWTRDDLGTTAARGLAGQTDDRVYATSTSAGDGPLDVLALDGATGRTSAHFELPTGAVLAAAGRTVAYALAYGSSGGRSTVVAVDLETGERLWTHTGQLQVSVWAGRPVDIDVDGRANQLTAPEARVVPGS